MFQESRFDPNARSWAGALGLMQVMTASGKSCGRPGQLSPRVNIKKSIFSRAPRRTMWKWQTRCGQPRRLAKNALLYVTRTVSHSRASHHTQRLNRLSFAHLGGDTPDDR